MPREGKTGTIFGSNMDKLYTGMKLLAESTGCMKDGEEKKNLKLWNTKHCRSLFPDRCFWSLTDSDNQYFQLTSETTTSNRRSQTCDANPVCFHHRCLLHDLLSISSNSSFISDFKNRLCFTSQSWQIEIIKMPFITEYDIGCRKWLYSVLLSCVKFFNLLIRIMDLILSNCLVPSLGHQTFLFPGWRSYDLWSSM